jgi:hypothetical protein
VFAVVRDQDGHAKQHVQALLRQSGRDLETKLRVVSDGEDGMRSLVGKLFNANEQHILDWYHIARRFEAIGKGLVYLPHVEDFEHRLSRHWQHLNRAKWKVWHGNLYGASIALRSFYDGVDIHVMTAEADSGQSSIQQVRERLAELWSYLTANQTRLINYGREYHAGHRISTARVESTVDQSRLWTNWWTGGWRRSSTCAGPDTARRCCSTRAVRYSTENWANTPDGRPPNHRRFWQWRHEPPGSFRSPVNGKKNCLLTIGNLR